MQLQFLGSGACFYPALHNTSAFFIHDSNLILLDCGETVYERLLECVDLNGFKQIYVVITHLHADHVGSLGSLLSYCKCILNKQIVIIHPEKTICELLALLGIEKTFYVYLAEFPNELENLKVIPYEVSHVPNMKCYGYEIIDQDMSIYYSGDSNDIPQNVLTNFLSGKIKYLYQDTSLHDSEHPTHMYVKKLEDIILKKEDRARVTCMHLDGDYREVLKNKGFNIVE